MFLKCVLKGRFENNVETRSIFHASTDSADAPDNVNAVAEWMAEYVDALLPATSEKFRYYAADVYQQVGVADDWTLLGSFTLTGAIGSAAQGYNANQDAGVLIAKTNVNKTVGKKFIPGILDDGNVNSNLSATVLGILASVLAAWITEFISTGTVTLTPAVFKKASGAFVPIVGGIVDSLVGSQRKRKPGNGD